MKTFTPVLRSVKQRLSKKKIYGFDIETCNNNKTFLCATIWGDDYLKTFYTKESLIEGFKNPIFYDAIIAASNLLFDFFGVFDGTGEMHNFDTLFRGSDLVYAKTYINADGFSLKRISKGKGQTKPLWFIDTRNYAMMSVEKLGDILKIPKLEHPAFLGQMPSNDAEWEELVTYNKRDSEISCKFMKFLYKSFERLGATPKLTIASTAMNLYKCKYIGEQRYYRMPEPYIKDIFKCYYGGRTECFRRGKQHNLKSYDYNSLYPSIANDIDLPDPNFVRRNEINSLHYIKKYDGCAMVDVYCPEMMYPLLPYRRKDNKVIFPTGTFSGCYTNIELREALRLGYTIKKVHTNYWFQKNCRPFGDYFSDLYQERLIMKYKDDPMELVIKLLMNGLTGKFGQKYDSKDNWITTATSINKLKQYKQIERFGDYFRVVQDTPPAAFCIPIWISYITAHGRIKLTRDLNEYQASYCDTDCVHTENDNVKCGSGLGMFKKEYTMLESIHCKAKMYGFTYMKDHKIKSKVKIKGLGTKIKYNEFNKLMKEPIYSDSKDALAIKKKYKKFIKFKEAKRRNFVVNEIIDMEKELSVEDDKRDWSKVFSVGGCEWSTPVCLIDGYTRKELNKMQTLAKETWQNNIKSEMLELINSDKFDKHSVGVDIDPEEFIENEIFWETL